MLGGRFGAAGARVVIEEFMDGEEGSLFALCDGQRAVLFGGAQDHKRAFDGDLGPNTGGMGSYSPAPVFTPELVQQADALIEGGADFILIETVFAWPGLGLYVTQALFAADFNAVLGGTLVIGAMFIVLNLLSNSIKFTQAGGQVIVSTALDDHRDVVLRVRDTGAGMSEQDLNVAMEPFRQLATSSRWGSGGTGLGLPLTKAMVEANSARFTLRSTQGEGTIVEITFPADRVVAQ
mgnify:CR=1 FL=1